MGAWSFSAASFYRGLVVYEVYQPCKLVLNTGIHVRKISVSQLLPYFLGKNGRIVSCKRILLHSTALLIRARCPICKRPVDPDVLNRKKSPL